MTRSVPCPRCGQLAPFDKTQNPDRPFCSAMCATHDLAAWASDEYRVAGLESPDHLETELPSY
ncbi:DNA gyrase inhibitor YacG [Chitinibacteraceae bacterium HSL-7]